MREYEKDGKKGVELAIVTDHSGKFEVLRYANGKTAEQGGQ